MSLKWLAGFQMDQISGHFQFLLKTPQILQVYAIFESFNEPPAPAADCTAVFIKPLVKGRCPSLSRSQKGISLNEMLVK
jgi:hypothetical protein